MDTFVATDSVVKKTMKKVWEDNNYLVCPHTAIAVAYHYNKMRLLIVFVFSFQTFQLSKFEYIGYKIFGGFSTLKQLPYDFLAYFLTITIILLFNIETIV